MAEEIRKRSEIGDRYKWDLTHIYPTDDAWKQAYGEVEKLNALFAAVGAGHPRVKALALITQKVKGQKFNSPCGACRQVMSEFLTPDTPVYIAVLDGKKRLVYCKKFSELMPFPFDKFTEK